MSKPLDKNELPPGSRLSRMKAQFQQKQMQEKEHKLLQMLDNQQQRAMQKATINGVLPSKYTANNGFSSTLSTPGSQSFNNYPTQPGKVRQMFEERRKGGGVGLPSNNLYSNTNGNNSNGNVSHRNGGLIGIDKSYPLDPLPPTKTRSSSSKSDPNPTPTTYVKNARNTIASKPVNLGQRRGVSLERPAGTPGSNSERVTPASRSRDRDSSFSSTNGTPGNLSRRASSGLNSYDDVNSNNISRSGVISTKYSDVYGQQDNNNMSSADVIAKRENNLAMKMKKMNITDDLNKSSQDYRPPSVRSTSPLKKSPPPRALPSTPAAKPAAAKKTAPAVKRNGPIPPGMSQCKICGRCFATDRIDKHETICKKTSNRKRKVFDPTKMRMQGTEAEPYLRRVSAKAPVKAPVAPKADASQKKSDWRKKHEEFIKTIRAAKEYQAHVAAGGNPADLPPPPPSDTSDYIQCPYCNRKFSEGAAERHIPKCKNIKSNKR